MKAYLLPKRMSLGPHVYVKVQLTSPTTMKLHTEGEEVDGLWLPSFEDNNAELGIIYIAENLSSARRWTIFRHELIHAIHDTDAWLRDTYGPQ